MTRPHNDGRSRADRSRHLTADRAASRATPQTPPSSVGASGDSARAQRDSGRQPFRASLPLISHGFRAALGAIVLVGLLAIVLGARARTLKQAAVARMNGSVGATASVTQAAVDGWIDERQRDASVAAEIARHHLAPAAGAGPGVASTRAAATLAGALTAVQRGGGFVAVWVLDAGGRVVASSEGAGPMPPDYASLTQRRVQPPASGTPGVVGPRRYPDGRVCLLFTAAVRTEGSPSASRATGRVVLEADPARRLFPMVTDVPVASRTAQSLLVMRDGGDIVVLTPLRFPPTRAMSLRLPWDTAPESFRHALHGRRGWLFTEDHRGVRTLAVTRRSERTGWGIVRHMDEREALGDDYWRPLTLEALVAVFALGLLTFVVLWYQRAIRLAHVETQLARAELGALQSQLQPHFLFNTLNTISELVYTEAAKADRIVARLGDLLRRTVDRAGEHEEPLREELAFIAAYLEIEQSRFSENLVVHWDVAPDTLDALVPRLILQPLVENAIRHGITPHADGGHVGIVAKRIGRMLELTAWNSGRQADPPSTWRERVGLGNTRARLRQLYGVSQRLDIALREGGGVRVRITLPFRAGTAVPAEWTHT
jgi:hypothetical protein